MSMVLKFIEDLYLCNSEGLNNVTIRHHSKLIGERCINSLHSIYKSGQKNHTLKLL